MGGIVRREIGSRLPTLPTGGMAMSQLSHLGSFDPKQRAFTLFEEFKNFALKGNMIDLAVGVIIGAAFGSIVNSLVKNIMMPLISACFPGQQGYEKWHFVLNGKDVLIGLFLADVANFLIVAIVLFIFIQKFLGFVLRNRKQEAAAPPPPTRDQELLSEIRDLLKQRTAGA
jgi:large conductance mechanosensitive channel